jgi:hypothetical protein
MSITSYQQYIDTDEKLCTQLTRHNNGVHGAQKGKKESYKSI